MSARKLSLFDDRRSQLARAKQLSVEDLLGGLLPVPGLGPIVERDAEGRWRWTVRGWREVGRWFGPEGEA